MTFKPEHVNDFLQLFEERKLRIRHFEGCTYLQLLQDQQHEHIFYTYSLWNSPQDLEAYRLSPLFEDTWRIVKNWFSQKAEAFSANTYTEIE